MKTNTLFFLIFILVTSCIASHEYPTSFPRTLSLPFDNDTGVPTYYAAEVGEYSVGGFAIDEDYNFYVLGSKPLILAKYTLEGNEIFRSSLDINLSGVVFVSEDSIFIFDYSTNINNLYRISARNGEVLDIYTHLTERRVNSYNFLDNLLILHVFPPTGIMSINTKLDNLVYNLNGNYVQTADNPYNIDEPNISYLDKSEFYSYLGMFKGDYLYHYWNIDTDEYILYLVNKNGSILKKAILPTEIIGDMLYGGVHQFWSLKNNYLGILAKKDSKALISIYDLNSLLSLTK